jgi:hypothetical protein
MLKADLSLNSQKPAGETHRIIFFLLEPFVSKRKQAIMPEKIIPNRSCYAAVPEM